MHDIKDKVIPIVEDVNEKIFYVKIHHLWSFPPCCTEDISLEKDPPLLENYDIDPISWEK